MIREILVIFLLFLPCCQGKVCGYEVSWKPSSEVGPSLQTVLCQTGDCREESIGALDTCISNIRVTV